MTRATEKAATITLGLVVIHLGETRNHATAYYSDGGSLTLGETEALGLAEQYGAKVERRNLHQ